MYRGMGSVALLIVAGLVGCGGGGGGDGGGPGGFSCAYVPGTVTSTSVGSVCADCSTTAPEAVADTNQGTAASVQVGTGQRTTTITDNYAGPSFPAGSKVGALMTLSGGATVASVTLNTSLDGVARESRSGASLTSESTGGTTAAQVYVFFESTLEFDSLELVISAATGNQYLIYEFCGDS